ncbi:MAG: RagB/SusD family nutrient uptake outer membrane protein, partial [Chitinophagaceae bacterium]|nr:RagB/SusD family nutrient uptake outer membrane protein [Chitinophagaceae bacterium]
MKAKLYVILLLINILYIGCRKMVEIGPPKTQLTAEKAFADDQTALAVLSNIYAQFNSLIDANLTPAFGSYADDLTTTSADQKVLEYFNGWVSPVNNINLNVWQGFYSVIYQSNSMLERIDVSPNVSSSAKRQLKGETLFLRGLSYFYLANIYGDVPLLLTSEVGITSTAERRPINEIYIQVIQDLADAKENLPEAYPSASKVRANKWGAIMLLARVHLYQQNWAAAESEATAVISSGIYSPLPALSEVFKINSKETILQFWTQNGYTQEALILIPSSGSIPTYPVNNLLKQSFEPGDQRMKRWIDSVWQGADKYYYPSKYKNRSSVSGNMSEYLVFLRLSELYLIRAEARTQQNNFVAAQSDLNTLRSRAGLSNTSANDKPSLLTAIEQERRVELFC